MQIEARFAHPHVRYGDDLDTHLIVTLTGDGHIERSSVGIIPVIDRSGSMASARKMEVAKAALEHLPTFLGDGDGIGLVSFDHAVTEHLVGSLIGAGVGVENIVSAVHGLRPRGTTNLFEGLTKGIDAAAQLRKLAGGKIEVRVLLITDGLANVGVTDPDEIAAGVSDLPAGVRVSTIGVGVDCDHGLLSQIAEAGGGSYGFAETPDDIAKVIGAEIGAALTVDTTNIVVQVAERRYASVNGPLGVNSDAVTISEDENGVGVVAVKLADVIGGTSRHLVFPVTLHAPARAHVRPVTAAAVQVSGVTPAGTDIMMKALPKVHFTDETTPPSLEMTRIVEMAQMAAAVREAEQHAAAGAFDEARGVLFRGASRMSPAMAEMLTGAAEFYMNAGTYTQTAPDRAAAVTSLSASGRLTGASRTYDAMWVASMGQSYLSDVMRTTAAGTSAAVRRSLGGAGRAERHTTQEDTSGVTSNDIQASASSGGVNGSADDLAGSSGAYNVGIPEGYESGGASFTSSGSVGGSVTIGGAGGLNISNATVHLAHGVSVDSSDISDVSKDGADHGCDDRDQGAGRDDRQDDRD